MKFTLHVENCPPRDAARKLLDAGLLLFYDLDPERIAQKARVKKIAAILDRRRREALRRLRREPLIAPDPLLTNFMNQLFAPCHFDARFWPRRTR